MSKVLEVKSQSGSLVGHMVRCPACEDEGTGGGHIFSIKMGDGSPGWSFNGDFERPTFSPSMAATLRFGDDRGDARCHCFVRGGRIEYLSDCTHAMAGQTVELPEFDE